MSEVLNEAEGLRQKMIALLLAERQAIHDKLALVGYDGVAALPKKAKVCSVCGSSEHNARTCDQRRQPEPVAAAKAD